MNLIKIGKFIAEQRKNKNLTQEQFAEKLGVTDSAISKWENGRGAPDISYLIPLSTELNISLLELLNGEKGKEDGKAVIELIKETDKKTRIFVKLDGPLYEIEYKLVDEFDKRYLLNRTMGGIGSAYTYTDDEKSASVAIVANSNRRDFSPFIDEKEFYEQCNSYDTDMYEDRKKNGGIFDWYQVF